MDATTRLQNRANARTRTSPFREGTSTLETSESASPDLRDSYTIPDDLMGTTLDVVCRHRCAPPSPENTHPATGDAPRPDKVAEAEPAKYVWNRTASLKTASNLNGTLTFLNNEPTPDRPLEFRGTFANYVSEPDRRGLLEPKNLNEVRTNRARDAERLAWEKVESRALNALTQAERIFKSHWRTKESQDLIPERRDSVTLEDRKELSLRPSPQIEQRSQGKSLLSYLRSLVDPATPSREPAPLSEILEDTVSGDASFTEEGRLVRLEAALRNGTSGEVLTIKLDPGLLTSVSGETSPGFRLRLENPERRMDPIDLYLDSEEEQIRAVEIPKYHGDLEPGSLLEGFSLLQGYRPKRPSRWDAFEERT